MCTGADEKSGKKTSELHFITAIVTCLGRELDKLELVCSNTSVVEITIN